MHVQTDCLWGSKQCLCYVNWRKKIWIFSKKEKKIWFLTAKFSGLLSGILCDFCEVVLQKPSNPWLMILTWRKENSRYIEHSCKKSLYFLINNRLDCMLDDCMLSTLMCLVQCNFKNSLDHLTQIKCDSLKLCCY